MTNSNISRELVGGNTTTQIGTEFNAQKAKSAAPTLQKAVVTEVIVDPFSLTEDEKTTLSKTVDNAELVSVMPINSIIAQMTNNGAGQIPKQKTILFPMFSSHLLLPIKVGETVYVIYEDYSGSGSKLGYWFTRISSPGTIEDVNYTHHDRRFDATHNPDNYLTQDKLTAKNNKEGPGFPNGGNTPESRSVKQDASNVNNKQDAYDQIKNASKTYNSVIREPVPRFRKRSGDLALQGSNNTLVVLGEDRYSSIDNADNKDYLGQAGTIDIVVGRGRKLSENDVIVDKNSTAARTVKNSKGELETDKAPFRKGFNNNNNPKEGNPDLKNDAARIYVSMQTNGDENFGLELNSNKENGIKLPTAPTTASSKNSSHGKSFVIHKGDHIRLIARKDDEEGIAGTVLLIREGNSDEDLGYFFIDEEGKIQIESKKIYFGLASPNDETNPDILYKNYEETIYRLQKQIDKLTTMVEEAFLTAYGNFGAPIPSLSVVGNGMITKANASDKARIEEITQPDKHSKKIFRENDVDFETKPL